jgi:hypothetical protein
VYEDFQSTNLPLALDHHVWDIFFSSFRQKPRQLIVEYYLHWTTTFEISFSGSSDTNHNSWLYTILPTLDHHIVAHICRKILCQGWKKYWNLGTFHLGT